MVARQSSLVGTSAMGVEPLPCINITAELSLLNTARGVGFAKTSSSITSGGRLNAICCALTNVVKNNAMIDSVNSFFIEI